MTTERNAYVEWAERLHRKKREAAAWTDYEHELHAMLGEPPCPQCGAWHREPEDCMAYTRRYGR